MFKFVFSMLALVSVISAETGHCEWIRKFIVPVPDFPKKGIVFQCYTDLFKEPDAFCRIIETFAERYRDANLDVIAGLDARGFIFGGALAYELGVPFVMVRKPSKLPRPVERIEYEMEFGRNAFEIELGSIQPGNRVLIIDDVLATGGTAGGASKLIERLGGEIVEIACVMELPFFRGRENLKRPIYSLIAVDMTDSNEG